MAPDEPEALDSLVEELVAECDWVYPDPVDLFEDELASRLGLRRHILLSQEGWRSARVVFISADPDADRVADQMRDEEDQTKQAWRTQWQTMQSAIW